MSTTPDPFDSPITANSEVMPDQAATVARVANLMPFLHAEERRGDKQAREAVFITFNASLNFFEARLLGVCQASGARTTIIADAGVWSPDARGARHAGRAYHVGLVQAPGAFHPKMFVLAGPQRAVVAVGSGNLTMGGWQYNAEVLTVFTGDRHSVPDIFADVTATLRSLSAEQSLDPFARKALLRTAAQLTALSAASPVTETGHRLLTSFDGSILGQLPLPTEPVDELLLYAPFHDPAAAAVKALIGRFQPASVKVAVQPGWTVLDSDALAEALAEAEASGIRTEVVEDRENQADGGRYRHGKLIEWSAQGQRWAVTGSPNLSAAALLRSARSNGNHEIAVLAPVGESLFPDGNAIEMGQVPTLRIEAARISDPPGVAGPVLVAAIKQPDGLHLHLAASAPCGAMVEISEIGDAPDAWTAIGSVAAGAQAHVLTSTCNATAGTEPARTTPGRCRTPGRT